MIKWFLLSLGLPSLIRLCQSAWHPDRTIKVPDSPYSDGKVNHPTVLQNHLEDKSAPVNDQRSIADEGEVLITEWRRSPWVWIYWKRWFCLCHASLKAGCPKPPSRCFLPPPPQLLPCTSAGMEGSWEHTKELSLKNQWKLVLFSCSPLLFLVFLSSFSSASPSHNSVASLSFPTPTSCPDPSTGFKCHLGHYVFNNLSKPLINSGKFFHGNMWCHPVTLQKGLDTNYTNCHVSQHDTLPERG